MSETAENSGEEAGEGALDVEAGEMTDGGEDDYDEEGSHHLVRETLDRADGEGGREGRERGTLGDLKRADRLLCLLKVNFPELFMARDLRERGFTRVNGEGGWTDSFSLLTHGSNSGSEALHRPTHTYRL